MAPSWLGLASASHDSSPDHLKSVSLGSADSDPRKRRRKAANPSRSLLGDGLDAAVPQQVVVVGEEEQEEEEVSRPDSPRKRAVKQNGSGTVAVLGMQAPLVVSVLPLVAVEATGLAGAVHKACLQCGVTHTPMWRSVAGNGPLCNKCGLRLKRKLGLL